MPRWLIPDGYLPGPPAEQQVSHESLCLLNVTDQDAEAELTVYFADREPLSGLRIGVPARRSIHARLDALRTADGDGIPLDVPYALQVSCAIPLGVQHSRLDARQANMALFTTLGQRAE